MKKRFKLKLKRKLDLFTEEQYFPVSLTGTNMKLKFSAKALFVISAAVVFAGIFYNDSVEITSENLMIAEKITGLTFSDAERDSMLEGLKEQLSNYKNIRNYRLNNSIPPALLFNPIPIGFSGNSLSNEVKFSNYSHSTVPKDINDIAFYSIGELAQLLKTRQITSVRLTEFFLNRLKKYNDTLKCVITFTEELALSQARKADKEITSGNYRGLLHGVPYGVKDLFSLSNYKTTWGAPPYREQQINMNATVIEKLNKSGAVLVAKFSMGELAWGDVWFGGMTRNPWDPSQGSSGSSAGSASAVSAGLVPFALGTETYGSIVSPSTVCGVTGLRPTYGRVSRNGAMALSWSMDKVGPICRNAEDCAIVLNSIYGPDNLDQSVFDFPFSYNPGVNIKKLKIGYLKEDFGKDYSFKSNDSMIIDKLKTLGIELIPIRLPVYPINDISIMLSAESSAAFDELTRSNQDDLLVRQIKNAWPNVFRMSRFIPAVEYINASRIRYDLIQAMHKLMKEVDLYLAPSWEGDNLLLTNLTGHPCITIPSGFSKSGMPQSITITGRLFEEGKIIALARFLQERMNFHKKHPSLVKN